MQGWTNHTNKILLAIDCACFKKNKWIFTEIRVNEHLKQFTHKN